MGGKIKLIIGILVFTLFLGGAYQLYNNLSEKYREKQGLSNGSAPEKAEKVKLPDFTVYNSGGNKVRLSDFKGKPVVINFWASWCPPCVSELPDFNKVYNDIGDSVVFMMVNLVDGSRETKESGENFVKSKKYNFPVYYDLDQDAAYKFGIYSIPVTVFVDEDGYLFKGYIGPVSESVLRNDIALLTK